MLIKYSVLHLKQNNGGMRSHQNGEECLKRYLDKLSPTRNKNLRNKPTVYLYIHTCKTLPTIIVSFIFI